MSSGMPFSRNCLMSASAWLGVVSRRRADEEPQPPLRRQRPAAAVEVVAPHRVHRRRPGEDEHLHAFGVRDRLHRIAPRLRLPALAGRAVDERRLLLGREAHAVADVHLEVPGGVEEHRVARSSKRTAAPARACGRSPCPSGPRAAETSRPSAGRSRSRRPARTRPRPAPAGTATPSSNPTAAPRSASGRAGTPPSGIFFSASTFGATPTALSSVSSSGLPTTAFHTPGAASCHCGCVAAGCAAVAGIGMSDSATIDTSRAAAAGFMDVSLRDVITTPKTWA